VVAEGDTALTVSLGVSGTTNSSVAGYDVVSSLVRSDGTTVSEELDTAGTAAIYAPGATVDNTDVTVYSGTAGGTATVFKSFTVTNGIATFFTTDGATAGTEIVITTANLAGALAVLQGIDIGTVGTTVAFKVANIDGGTSADELMVFTQGTDTGADNSKDVLVMLKDQGVVDALIITNNNAGTNDLFIK
jgi:hypothetical protein